MIKSIFFILMAFTSLAQAARTKRLFDYDFPVGKEVQTPNSQAHQAQDINQSPQHQATIGESNVHQTSLNEKININEINNEHMGNFPDLINHIDSALSLMNQPTQTSINEIKEIDTNGVSAKPTEIHTQKVYEPSTPDIKIFDNNQ